MSAPLSSICVAIECRKIWHAPGLSIRAVSRIEVPAIAVSVLRFIPLPYFVTNR